MKIQLPRFPDFWGTMDPIGVRKSDFASLRMTGHNVICPKPLNLNIPCACREGQFSVRIHARLSFIELESSSVE